MSKKVVLLKGDVNMTVQFYFDTAEGTEKKYWQMMDKLRMREIFEYCLRCPKISSHAENRIFNWIEEEFEKKLTVEEKNKIKSK